MSWSSFKTEEFLMPDISKNISANLKLLRDTIGISQKELCQVFDISQQTYNGYERGRHEPPISFLVELAFFYKMPLDTIVGIDCLNPKADRFSVLAPQMNSEHLTSLEAMVLDERANNS